MRIFRVLPLVLLFAMSACFMNQNKTVVFDRHIALYHDYHQFNGSALVSENGKKIFNEEYGLLKVDKGEKISNNTVFPLGEISRLYTAALALKLIEEGILDPNATVGDFNLTFNVNGAGRIRISDLIGRNSRLQELTEQKGLKNIETEFVLDIKISQGLQKCSLNGHYEKNMVNETTDYIILGKIIEMVTKSNFKQVMENKLFKKMGLKGTFFVNDDKKIVNGYVKGAGRYVEKKVNINPYLLPVVGVCSTMDDLYLFANNLFSNKYISKSYLDVLLKVKDKVNTPWGGYYNGPFNMDIFFCHSVFGGCKAQLFYIEKSNDMVLLLSNLNSTPPYKFDVVNGIIAALYNLPIGSYLLPTSSLTDFLSVNYNKYPVEKLISEAKALMLLNRKSYVLEDKEFIVFCRDLIQLGKTDDALKTAMFAIEIKPKSSELYLNVAYVHSLKKDFENALKYCEKSLELNPWNRKAIDLLQRLKKEEI